MKYKGVSKIYITYLILSFLGFLGVIASLIGGDGNSTYKIYWVIIYFFTIIIFFLTQKKDLGKKELVILVFGIFILSSTLWSTIWRSSAFYSISYFMNLLSALIISRIFSLKDFLKIFLWCLFLISLIGIVITFLGYEKGYFIDPLDRSNVIGIKLIQGLFSHKIFAGLYGSIGAILAYLTLNGLFRKLTVLWFIFSVLISGSSLGLVILLLAFIINSLIEFFSVDSRKPILMIFLLFVGLLLLIGDNLYYEILTALGRDPGLTGRTHLWGLALDFFMQSPIIGWGYGGIFGDGIDAPSRIFNFKAYYQAPHFHNGYLQALAELGSIGASFIFFMMIYVLVKSINFYYRTKNIEFKLVCIIIFLLMTAALGMNLFMRYNELSIFILVYFYLSLNKYYVMIQET